MRKKILSDHKRVNNKLLTPFNSFLSNGTFKETPYVKSILPEIIWQAILNDKLGVALASHNTLELIKALDSDNTLPPLCFASNLKNISDEKVENAQTKCAQSLEVLTRELRVFIRVFPECPLKVLFRDYYEEAKAEDVKYIKSAIDSLLNKLSRQSTLAIANVMYYIFETERFTVTANSELLNLGQITYYPDTEKSRAIASSLRASLNLFVGNEMFIEKNGWPEYFWNTAHKLEPCNIDDLYFE